MQKLPLWASLLLCAATIGAPSALAQTFPDKPVTLVVPFAAGGSADAVARSIGAALGKDLGQTVVIENFGGASGSIGAARVARARPDGYTLLLGTSNDMVLAPLVNPAVPYKPEDFKAVGKIGETAFILVGRQGIAAHNTDELVELARKSPGKLSYATAGIGTAQHVLMEIIQEKAGISLLHVPYRSAAQLVTDLLGGRADLALVAPATFPAHIESGRVQTFGITSLRRDESLKNIPTLNEGKYIKGVDLGSWVGIFVPANTPAEVARRLGTAVDAALADADTVARLKKMSITPAAAAEQAGFASAIVETRAQLRAVVSRMNLAEGAK